jgi:single stranded DNA-binding protein
MNTLNRVTLMGTVGKNQKAGEGDHVQLSLATYDCLEDLSGEFKRSVDWHTIKIFNEAFLETVVPTLQKGDLVFIEGTLKTRECMDTMGNSYQASEVIVGHGKGNVLKLKPSLEVLDDGTLGA